MTGTLYGEMPVFLTTQITPTGHWLCDTQEHATGHLRGATVKAGTPKTPTMLEASRGDCIRK